MLFVVFAFLFCTLSFSVQAQRKADDQIGYPNTEYYTVESLLKEYSNYNKNNNQLPDWELFIKSIYRGARSAGMNSSEISMPRPVFMTTDIPFADDYEGITFPLIQIRQFEGQRHIFLNITPSRLLAEAWLIKHPQDHPEVLNTFIINSDEFYQLGEDWEKQVIHGIFFDSIEIWRFRNRIPKALAFLTEIFRASGHSDLMHFNIDTNYTIRKCLEDTLPFLENIIEINLKLSAQKFKKNTHDANSKPIDLPPLVPDCL